MTARFSFFSRLATPCAMAFGLALLLVCHSSVASAAVFAQYTPSRHDRFLANGSPNPNFIMAAYDLSGISLGTPGDGIPNNASSGGIDPMVGTSRAVLITPQHYIAAAHAGTTTPRFRGSDGIIRDYVSSGLPGSPGSTRLTTNFSDGSSALSDIQLYRLSEPIPAAHGVTPLPVLSGNPFALIGHPFFLSSNPRENADESLTHRAGMNVVRDIVNVGFGTAGTSPTTNLFYTFDTATNGGFDGMGGDSLGIDEAGLIGGDSGNPAFVDVNGELVVLGAHFGIGVPAGNNPGAGDFYESYTTLLTTYLPEIQAFTQRDGFTVRTLSITAVPEPSGLIGWIVGVGLLTVRSRRRRS